MNLFDHMSAKEAQRRAQQQRGAGMDAQRRQSDVEDIRRLLQQDAASDIFFAGARRADQQRRASTVILMGDAVQGKSQFDDGDVIDVDCEAVKPKQLKE